MKKSVNAYLLWAFFGFLPKILLLTAPYFSVIILPCPVFGQITVFLRPLCRTSTQEGEDNPFYEVEYEKSKIPNGTAIIHFLLPIHRRMR